VNSTPEPSKATAGDTLAAALDYGLAGLPVLPLHSAPDGRCSCGKPACKDAAKHPRNHNGLTGASTDPAVIAEWWRRWPDANVGIRTGDGTVVLDVDPQKGGLSTLQALERKHGRLPLGPLVVTGSGGQHLYFAGAASNSVGKLGDGLDVRGEGGYVVAPPSVHETGKAYKWHRPLNGSLPAWPFKEATEPSRTAPAVTDEIPSGQRNATLASLAGTMRRRGMGKSEILAALTVANRDRCRPPLDGEEVERIAESIASMPAADPIPAPPRERAPVETTADVSRASVTLDDVLAAVRAYLDVTEAEHDYIIVALAVAVAKALADEEPLWLILAGPSGGGKTEAIRLPALVADCRVDELTRAGLLSYSALGKKVRRAGLLTRVPPVSFVTISDFSTVVTMGDREARARMFGMLRVVYDGRVYRSIGGQPGSEGEALEWEGHLTLLAGATNAIDTHLSFEATLGERWLLFRLDEAGAARARRRTVFATERADVPQRRAAAQELAAALVVAARDRVPRTLSDETRDRIVDAAVFCAHARTGVQFEGTGKYRVPVGLPMPEEPMRLAGQLTRLARCLVALGLDEHDAARIAIRAACDSVPLARFRALREVAETTMATVASVHRALGRGNRWAAKWELMALEAIGMVDVGGTSEDEDPNATRVYSLKDEYSGVYESVGSFFISV
jgi:hypothetical protein